MLWFSSVQSLSRVRLFATPWIAAARPPCPSPTPGVHSDSRPSSQWCHTAISSSLVPFSSWPQSLPASESFPMSQLFAWGGQSTGVSALASFLRKQHSWIIKGMSSRVGMALKPNSTAYLPLCDTEEVKCFSVLQFTSSLVIMRIKWVDTVESVLKTALSLVCTY